MNIVIEEYANVDETFQNIKNIKVGSMTLNDLFGDNLKVIENALEERKELLKWKNSQQDLIKGKDEYIAKLCNDRAELKEELKQVEGFKYHYDRYKKELANKLKVINCMQEEETTNRNLIDSLEDRNDRLVERLEKQKAKIKSLELQMAIIVGNPFEDNKPKAMELYRLDTNDITDLVKFAEIMASRRLINPRLQDSSVMFYDVEKRHSESDFVLVKKVVEKYGKKEN